MRTPLYTVELLFQLPRMYCCLVSSFGLLVSFQLVIGILQHFSIVLVSYKSLVFLLV